MVAAAATNSGGQLKQCGEICSAPNKNCPKARNSCELQPAEIKFSCTFLLAWGPVLSIIVNNLFILLLSFLLL